MRTRHVTLTLLTVVALGAAPLALADPLDPDPSFGGDGTVMLAKYGISVVAGSMAVHGPRTVAAGPLSGDGTSEIDLHVALRGRHGALVGGHQRSGILEYPPFGWPKVVDVLTTDHRIFVVGSVDKTYEGPLAYGYVAAFSASLRNRLTWGTERFRSPDVTGLERLREVDFGSVTGGALDSRGRVLVTGRIDGQTAIVRLTPNGLDHSYGTNGVARLTIGTASSPRDIAVHGTTTLVVGNTTINGHQQGFATQITGYGYRDRTFSSDGIRLIGKPGTHVTAVDKADTGRWLVTYESGKRAGVTKIGATGDLVTGFGRGGRATIRCTRPESRNVIDSLAVDRRHGTLNQITLALTCKRDGDLRRLAAIWRPGGQPITSLKPDGVGRLPWNAPTIDLTYGWRGRLIGLIPNRIIRLH